MRAARAAALRFGDGERARARRSRVTRRFRFGICTDQNMTWEKTVERWQLFERLGYESAWLCDHLVQPSRPEGPASGEWPLLRGLAARTRQRRVDRCVAASTAR